MKILDKLFKRKEKSLTAVDTRESSLWQTIWETSSGYWQQHYAVEYDSVVGHSAVFSCMTLIAADISKLRVKLVEMDSDGIWSETTSPAYSPLLRKPNHYQTANQFLENWMLSKLSRGNTYALKQRDNRGVVTALYILDPQLVTPLVSEVDASVFYQLRQDNLAGINGDVVVPAREIIHDRMNCLFHPLVGISPIYASGLAATQGLAAQNNSTRLSTNMSRPSGILTAPGTISQETAARLKTNWETNYSGANFGKVAVLGDGLKYEKISLTAQESQMMDQLKWTDEVVCSTFHVPPFKIGIGTMPTYQNAEVLNQIYYSDCLQSLIEHFESCMDDGLGLITPINGRQVGIELDIDGLMRMDQATKMRTLGEGVKGSILAPNEARKRCDLKPVPGGDSVYSQQQNWSLEQLDRRDIINDAPSVAAPEPSDDESEDESDEMERFFDAFTRGFEVTHEH